MRTITTHMIQTPAYVTEVVTCNFCGESHTGRHVDMADITEFTIQPGYGSKYDDDNYRFDICDKCLGSLIRGESVAICIPMERDKSY